MIVAPDNEDILFKDSVYTAIGLAADILHDQLDFDAFLANTLVAEAGKQKPGFNIIRRRIAIVISQWIAIKIAQEKKPIVYQIFQHLLDTSDPLNDQVVRVTAGRRFKDIADEWEFHADNFLPYAPTTLERLMALVQEVDLPDTKMALLNTISIIVERLEYHVSRNTPDKPVNADRSDHTVRQQHRQPSATPLGAIRRGTPHEASHPYAPRAPHKRHESRLSHLPHLLPAHHPISHRARVRNTSLPPRRCARPLVLHRCTNPISTRAHTARAAQLVTVSTTAILHGQRDPPQGHRNHRSIPATRTSRRTRRQFPSSTAACAR